MKAPGCFETTLAVGGDFARDEVAITMKSWGAGAPGDVLDRKGSPWIESNAGLTPERVCVIASLSDGGL